MGRWDFCDLTLAVRSPCLCPRPETEELVDRAAEEVGRILHGRGRPVRVLDVGCGTGAIGLALASRFGRGKIDVTAIDIEPTAVELSNENSRDILGGEGIESSENLPYNALLCDASDFTNAGDNGRAYEFGFDVVVSNPPYIPRVDMDTLTTDVVGYEADSALCGGEDGLDVVRSIVERLPEWSSAEGCICWMEVDTSHPKLLEEWLSGHDAKERNVEFLEKAQDLCGRDRFVKLQVHR